ncbi:cryptococcal mannosyltransferase 1-domain-containing protein, partial [Diplogelasinospora grovesii]
RVLLRRGLILSLVDSLLAWSFLDALLVRYHLYDAARVYSTATLNKPPRIYIPSLFWNNENVLHEFWSSNLLALTHALGPENVYVSILESGSWDGSKAALRELAQKLDDNGVARSVTREDRTHADEIANAPAEAEGHPGWVKTPRRRIELRRIPYLAKLRNMSLRPLRELVKNGTTFDYVLFLGGVYFTVPDVIALINTNNGKYAAACALDFNAPPKYYDTFALRDAEGHGHPYFRSSKSRKAAKRSAPVPVRSCWNGMVIMPAATFQDGRLAFRGTDDTLAETHLEASECCLVHADNPASAEQGAWLNPNVRVGYSTHAYHQVHPSGGVWLSYWEIWLSLWKNRSYRWFTTPLLKERMCRSRQYQWEHAHPDRHEKGSFCLIDEMQVLVGNGWAHV